MKSLQAAAAAAIRRASEEGGSSARGSMDGSQRAIIRDLSQKVSDLCRELADARRQQHMAQASLLLHGACWRAGYRQRKLERRTPCSLQKP